MKILVVGAGFSGAVVARELAEFGLMVDVIDKRLHIGGNAYDETNEHGIRVHKYGPHLFHTNNEVVFNWLSRFTDWIPYKHKVKAMLPNGKLVTLPINKATRKIVGNDNLVDTFIRPYSEKMWGIPLESLDPNVINRVPIRDDNNQFYFPDDLYQYMPKDGYAALFEAIFRHPNISVRLGVSFSKDLEQEYDHVFCSIPIDEYYDYRLGELPYRSIKFHHLHFPAPKIFPVAVVNFTHTGKHTRVVEWKNIPGHGKNETMTTLTYEEPCDYKENHQERYYPVKDIDGKNRALYLKYESIPNTKVTFIGRLGLYAYLDMHQCINSALVISKKFIHGIPTK